MVVSAKEDAELPGRSDGAAIVPGVGTTRCVPAPGSGVFTLDTTVGGSWLIWLTESPMPITVDPTEEISEGAADGGRATAVVAEREDWLLAGTPEARPHFPLFLLLRCFFFSSLCASTSRMWFSSARSRSIFDGESGLSGMTATAGTAVAVEEDEAIVIIDCQCRMDCVNSHSGPEQWPWQTYSTCCGCTD